MIDRSLYCPLVSRALQSALSPEILSIHKKHTLAAPELAAFEETPMLLHLLYVIAFTTLAFFAVGNLIRNMMTLGMESQRSHTPNTWQMGEPQAGRSRFRTVPHPEFLDATGNVINEPLLVMRSMSMEDAREQLDAIYESSPGASSSGANDRDDV